jgi:hypothetical protein
MVKLFTIVYLIALSLINFIIVHGVENTVIKDLHALCSNNKLLYTKANHQLYHYLSLFFLKKKNHFVFILYQYVHFLNICSFYSLKKNLCTYSHAFLHPFHFLIFKVWYDPFFFFTIFYILKKHWIIQ